MTRGESIGSDAVSSEISCHDIDVRSEVSRAMAALRACSVLSWTVESSKHATCVYVDNHGCLDVASAVLFDLPGI